ncbi:MAG: DUF296 domain-containing protein [Paludibaculum sp.]
MLAIALMLWMAQSAGTAEMAARREAAVTERMQVHVIRLRPGDDLLEKLAAYAKEKSLSAAVILSGVGEPDTGFAAICGPAGRNRSRGAI